MKGILDRIEDGRQAVILIEEEQREIVFPADRLPPGSKVNSWFDIVLEDEEITSISLDAETAAAKERQVQGLLQRLRGRRSRSRFKRK